MEWSLCQIIYILYGNYLRRMEKKALQQHLKNIQRMNLKRKCAFLYPADLENYRVNWKSRKYNFWQPKPHQFLLFSEKMTLQKLNYIHMNPLQEKWKLADDPLHYFYSSASFYHTGIKNFDFLYDYRDYNEV